MARCSGILANLLTLCCLRQARAGNRRPVSTNTLDDSEVQEPHRHQAGGEGIMVPRPSYCIMIYIICCSCYSRNTSYYTFLSCLIMKSFALHFYMSKFPALVDLMMVMFLFLTMETWPKDTTWRERRSLLGAYRQKIWAHEDLAMPDSTDSIPGAKEPTTRWRCHLTAEPKEPGLRGTYQEVDPTMRDTGQGAKIWWTARCGEIGGQSNLHLGCQEIQGHGDDKVQDDLSQAEDQVLVHPARGGSVAICSGILANRFTTLKKQKDIYFGWS